MKHDFWEHLGRKVSHYKQIQDFWDAVTAVTFPALFMPTWTCKKQPEFSIYLILVSSCVCPPATLALLTFWGQFFSEGKSRLSYTPHHVDTKDPMSSTQYMLVLSHDLQ